MLPQQTNDERSGRLAACYRGKNILVTGGFGFVGSHLTYALVGLGANVSVFDTRTDSSVASLLNDRSLELRRRIRIIPGDLADRAAVLRALEMDAFQFIFNFAAYATVIEKAVASPYDTIQANTLGLVNLLESVRQLRLQPTRILHASTDKVYGEMDGEAYDEEKTPLRGIGVYDSAKLAADLFARTYHEIYGLPTVVLRMCNIFGPGDFNTGHRLIPRSMCRLYSCTEPRGPELYFDAIEHWRDYLYIDDCIRAFLLVGFSDECRGEAINLPAIKFISTPNMLKEVLSVAYEIEREFDAARAEAILEAGIVVRVRGPDVHAIRKQRVNGSKLKRLTEFEPAIGFHEALERTVRAYRGHYQLEHASDAGVV